jgi:carboxyl-terminal processing protease
MAAQRRALFVVPVFILGCALTGGLLGSSGQSGAPAMPAATSDAEVNNSLNSFSKVYDLVEDNYADKVGPDKGIYKGAIPGMLRTLDPHSNFFDPKDFAGLREEQKGRYYGVGMSIQPQPKTGRTMVVAPFPGSPAYKAGIRPGDVVMAVNDKRTDTLTTPEVADLLKGPRGTKVQIAVQRDGVEKPLTFNVIRDEVRRDSIDAAFWLKPSIAYIDMTQFTETTSEELEADLKKLGEQNIGGGLILDLRNDPGGLLQEAVAVAGRWLQRGQVVVSHKGRAYNEKPYLAHGSQYGLNYPIVVLVDRYTASAAEIVSGALQDHDRGWVMGDTTFGKGLVQTVFPLSDNTGLALTTQHYYTPSGRLIQRDYSKMSFLDYYYGRRGEAKDSHDVKSTDLGRVVYGGGGITPDEHYDAPKANPFQVAVLRKNAFFTFTAQYFGGKDARLPKGWAPDEPLMNTFHDSLMKQGVQFTEADWTANHDWLRNRLQQEMYITAFSLDDSKRLSVSQDPEVQKAIEALPKAADLLAKMKSHSEVIRASNRR